MVESDHNVLIADLNINWRKPYTAKQRPEYFNFRNKENQGRFYEKTNNSTQLSQCFSDVKGNVETQSKRFNKKLDSYIHQSFKKIRFSGKVKYKPENDYIKG